MVDFLMVKVDNIENHLGVSNNEGNHGNNNDAELGF
jgi:hypothetical protein